MLQIGDIAFLVIFTFMYFLRMGSFVGTSLVEIVKTDATFPVAGGQLVQGAPTAVGMGKTFLYGNFLYGKYNG